jgi:hypothetical protein
MYDYRNASKKAVLLKPASAMRKACSEYVRPGAESICDRNVIDAG